MDHSQRHIKRKLPGQKVAEFHKVYIEDKRLPSAVQMRKEANDSENEDEEDSNPFRREPTYVTSTDPSLNTKSVANGDISIKDFLKKWCNDLETEESPSKRTKIDRKLEEKINSIEQQNFRIINMLERLDKKITAKNDSMVQITKTVNGLVDEHKTLRNKIDGVISSHIDFDASNKNVSDDLENRLPLKTCEEIDEFEDQLSDESYYTGMVHYLSTLITDTEYDKAARALLTKIFPVEMAINCNWTGQHNKIAANSLKCIPAIKDALIVKNVHKEDANFEKVVQDWFRRANDRFKYHKIRGHLKHEQEYSGFESS